MSVHSSVRSSYKDRKVVVSLKMVVKPNVDLRQFAMREIPIRPKLLISTPIKIRKSWSFWVSDCKFFVYYLVFFHL